MTSSSEASRDREPQSISLPTRRRRNDSSRKQQKKTPRREGRDGLAKDEKAPVRGEAPANFCRIRFLALRALKSPSRPSCALGVLCVKVLFFAALRVSAVNFRAAC